jgi:hypothetical protein
MANYDPSSARQPPGDEPGRATDEGTDEPLPGTSSRPDWNRGFSLAQLFLLFVVVSVFLAVIRCFSPHIAAGLAGLAVLVGLVVMSLGDPPAIVQLTWWALLAVYLMAAGMAVLRG